MMFGMKRRTRGVALDHYTWTVLIIDLQKHRQNTGLELGRSENVVLLMSLMRWVALARWKFVTIVIICPYSLEV